MSAFNKNQSEWQVDVTTFESLDDAFMRISEQSHAARGNLKRQRRNHDTLHLVCKEITCPFEARVTYIKRKRGYFLRQYNGVHSCLGAVQQARGSAQSAKYVEAKVRQGMAITKQSTAKQIIAWCQREHGPLAYHSALRVLSAIQGDEVTQQAQQFMLLPSYAQTILIHNPTATVKIKLAGHRLSSFFVAPSASTEAWPHLRPFIAIDAAWTKVLHQYILVLATGIDANQQGINLAWGIVPCENYDHWAWFLDNLALALPAIDQRSTVIISDRQKGLNRAVQHHLPNTTEAFCCKHLERNMTLEFGVEVKGPFWKAVYARTRLEFDRAMAKIKEINER